MALYRLYYYYYSESNCCCVPCGVITCTRVSHSHILHFQTFCRGHSIVDDCCEYLSVSSHVCLSVYVSLCLCTSACVCPSVLTELCWMIRRTSQFSSKTSSSFHASKYNGTSYLITYSRSCLLRDDVTHTAGAPTVLSNSASTIKFSARL